MFYNWIAINYIINNSDTKIPELYKRLTTSKYYFKIFPKPATCKQAQTGTVPKNSLEGVTSLIINQVFFIN